MRQWKEPPAPLATSLHHCSDGLTRLLLPALPPHLLRTTMAERGPSLLLYVPVTISAVGHRESPRGSVTCPRLGGSQLLARSPESPPLSCSHSPRSLPHVPLRVPYVPRICSCQPTPVMRPAFLPHSPCTPALVGPRPSLRRDPNSQQLRPRAPSSPRDHWRSSLRFSARSFIYLLFPQARHMSSGSRVPVWAVGFVNGEQSVCIEIMHLGDSSTRYLMSRKISGVLETAALSCILLTEKDRCRDFTQMETGILCSLASNCLGRLGSWSPLTAAPPVCSDGLWTCTCDQLYVPRGSVAL